MTAALILTSASHTIACASCNAPWPREAAQCPGCGRSEEAPVATQVVAPSPDDIRRQLRMVTSERDEAARATARLIEGVGRAEAERDDLRAQLAAVTAERDAMRAAAVEHLAATDAYARAHLAPMSATADGRRRRDEAVAAAFLRAQSARRALNALLPTERPS